MTRDYMDSIVDMGEAISEIESFVRGMDQAAFEADRKTMNAVLRSLEVLGEAARSIPETIRQKYPTIPWLSVVGMRNKLIHEYFGVDKGMVWETIQTDLPALKIQVEQMRSGESGR